MNFKQCLTPQVLPFFQFYIKLLTKCCQFSQKSVSDPAFPTSSYCLCLNPRPHHLLFGSITSNSLPITNFSLIHVDQRYQKNSVDSSTCELKSKLLLKIWLQIHLHSHLHAPKLISIFFILDLATYYSLSWITFQLIVICQLWLIFKYLFQILPSLWTSPIFPW